MSDNRISLQNMLEGMSTEELDAMLQAELKAEHPDDDAVRRILGILREREKDVPVEPSPEAEAAWEEYRQNREARKPKRNILLRAASVVLAVGLLFLLLPQSAQAESIFDLLARWSDGFVEFFTSEHTRNGGEYTFQTDHPGLQELYDTVAELGVDGPAVPMWAEETMVLGECKVIPSESKTYVMASFGGSDGSMIYKIDIYDAPVAHKYYKDETIWGSYENSDIIHTIMRNKDFWVVVWSRDNIECSLSVDCQEDVLYKILGSIYNEVEAK